jgi:flagellin
MILNTNIASLNTQRNLQTTNNAMQKSLEKLSSGYRINRAADDAAGLAISETMKAQINGLNQAKRNAQDGISLIQTAEGALNETHSILQRLNELATQASNGTYQTSDLGNIQKEVTSLLTEVGNIAANSKFNGTSLLSAASTVTLQIGTTSTETMAVALSSATATTLGVNAINLGSMASARAALETIKTA